jgi:type VI secretion system protein ImpC
MDSTLEGFAARAAEQPPSLPLRLLVVADCLAGTASPPVGVDSTGVQGLLERLRPRLGVAVPNRLGTPAPKLTAELELGRLEDFSPEALLARIPALAGAAAANHPAVGDQLDEILHAPSFQRLEACWRGLDRLCREAASLRGVSLELLPASRRELKEAFHRHVFEPEIEGTSPIPLSAVYFDFQFSHEPADLALLEPLAEQCEALQVPMVAAVSPAFFQLKNLIHLARLPDIAARLQQPAYTAWRRFQTSSKSRWVSLTANRYLARERYEVRREQGAPVDYSEKADAAHPERYTWAEAGWLVFCNLARSFSRFRHCTIIDGMAAETLHRDLPVRPFPKKANVEVPSPTEILIDDDKAWEIVRGGVTMLVGISDGAVASFPLVANVYRLRPGTITTESALSYQLFASHLAHFLAVIYSELPAGGAPEAVASFLRDRLAAFLVPFDRETPEATVGVEFAEVAGDPPQRTVKISLKPSLKMQSKDVDFTFHLSL